MYKKAVRHFVFVFVSAFALLSGKAAAQDTYRPRLSAGLKGGMSYSMINTDIKLDTSLILTEAVYGGLKFSYKKNKIPGLLLELNIMSKGGLSVYSSDKLSIPEDTMLAQRYFNIRTDYIEVPVLTELSFGNSNSKFRINFGPHVGFLLKQEMDFVESEPKYYTDKIKSNFEFGLNAGIGYAYVFSAGEIDLEIRYSHGLSNLYNPQSINSAFVTQNQSLSACLSYRYNLFKKKTKHLESKKSESEIKEK